MSASCMHLLAGIKQCHSWVPSCMQRHPDIQQSAFCIPYLLQMLLLRAHLMLMAHDAPQHKEIPHIYDAVRTCRSGLKHVSQVLLQAYHMNRGLLLQ